MRVNGGLVGAFLVSQHESAFSPRARRTNGRLERRPPPRLQGEGPAETQDDVRASFSGRFIRQKRWSGRGTGAAKATGSYEGSLTMKGISGRHEPSPFTRRWSRRPWRLPHAEKRYGSQEPKLRRLREGAPVSAPEGEATEMSEVRPQWAPWTENVHARELRVVETRRSRGKAARVQLRPTEAYREPVKPSIPWSAARSPRLREVSPRRKPRSEPGAHEVEVLADSFRWQTLVGRIARLGPLEVARLRGGIKQGASRKEARSTA